MLGDGFHAVPAGKLAMVVTYLEMHARPALRDIALGDGLTFRKVTAPSRDWYRDVFSRVGARDWLWFERLTMSDDDLDAILGDPKVEVFTLARDGTDEALLELDFRKEGECELAYFGLTSRIIGTGAGRFLMNHAITRAWDAGISRFHVHTCTIDSPQAINFYIRSGFTPYKREVEIADDPRLTGLLPRDTAQGVPIL